MEKEDYLEHALQVVMSNHQYKVAVAQTWQDKLMESIKDDEDYATLLNAMKNILDDDTEKPIKLSNPEKLASDYALLNGDSVTIKYVDEDNSVYYYKYKIRTRPTVSGKMFIQKKKFDNRVYIEFHHDNGGSEKVSYEMDDFINFDTFMNLIVDVIRKF